MKSEAAMDALDGLSFAEMPIAIIGMSCRFPGDADTPDKFWELCSNGRSAWSEIPETRFNKDAFYHPLSEKSVTTHVTGGHFLRQDLGHFDAAFFNMTAEMASTMDPQLRILLESVFEALENAGIPLAKIAGTRTSVFSAAFFRDYMDSIIRDPQNFPRYVMTGNGSTMMSNRISHFFDLRGPSMTIDTGCSTGLTALHQACQGLRARESDMSIIGGANVMLNPDIFVLFSSLGFLSPDGRSYAFDSRAAGYGRGEGVSSIILKPLQQALKDGDPVRGVIRHTALNQDGKTQTITSPSRDAQEDLIKACYKSAGLSPTDTPYVEAHGTGTAAGDPIEAAAIGNVFGEDRSSDRPLFIGSVKTNVGHMESVSGFAAILKVVMALEHEMIPPSINFEKPNPAIDFEALKLKIPRSLEKWPAHSAKRASISNFGYGGANAHVIMESLESWLQSSSWQTKENGHSEKAKSDEGSESSDWLTIEDAVKSTTASIVESSTESAGEAASTSSSDAQVPILSGQSRVFLLSAKEESIAQSMVANLRNYILSLEIRDENDFLDSLAYTLSERRSRFPMCVAVAARSLKDLTQALGDPGLKPGRGFERPRLGFVFTGQGAQWYGMGRELIEAYPIFKDSLRECDHHLRDLGASWSLIEELKKDEESSRVNHIVVGPPLCIAVQISLVRLLASWNIKPTAITSHSSGEVAAAFAAGAIDCHDAMAIVFARGPYLERLQEARTEAPGGMMAIGLSREMSQHSISQLTSGEVVIAAVNSPSSVTVSGDLQAIEELEYSLSIQKVFARRLKIAVAYHSHHMAGLEKEYLDALYSATKYEGEIGNLIYASPVTGKRMPIASRIVADHWIRNMLGTVEFLDAFRAICLPETQGTIRKEQETDTVVEVGPHSALAGPIRQILAQPDLRDRDIGYTSCLTRRENAVDSMQRLVCSLISKGYPVDLSAVNFPGSPIIPKVIHSLPNYPWNHQTRHWVESRLNQSHRFKSHPHHELLGSLMAGTNIVAPTWRDIVRPFEIPWLRDHLVQGEIVYPGAGLIVMAIEAIRQLTDETEVSISGYELRDVDIKAALVIPDLPEGIEVQLSLHPCNDRMLEKDWFEFVICSVVDSDSWVEHCKGLIRVQRSVKDDNNSWDDTASMSFIRSRVKLGSEAYPTQLRPANLFKSLQTVGITHGPAFKNITALSMGPSRSVATFSIADTQALMPGQHEHGHLVHPTTLDSVLQGAYASLPELISGKKVNAMVPKLIKYIFISREISSEPGHCMKSYSIFNHLSVRGFEASIVALSDKDPETGPIMEIDGLFCQALGETTSTGTVNDTNKCFTLTWDRDIHLTDRKSLNEMLKIAPDPTSRLVEEKLKRAAFCFISDTLASLTAQDVKNLSWYHRRFYEWMELQEELVLKRPTWQEPSDSERVMLLEEISDTIDGQMIIRIGKQLIQILRQQVAPLELMLEGGLLYKYYKRTPRLDRCYAQVSRLIKLFKHNNPQASILEVGGGTGGCTECVLDALGGGDTGTAAHFAHYDFTDISAGFFEKARGNFAAWGDLISFRILDIENEPSLQGFNNSSYDLVIACQVLHATHSMDVTMTQVRRLLKPGGTLIMVETTNDVVDMQLIFGTLPGWWMSEERDRQNSPSLTIEMWNDVLCRTGFSGLDVAVQDCEDPSYVMSVLMSTAKPHAAPAVSEAVVICHAGGVQLPVSWLDDLKTSLRGIGVLTVEVQSLERVDTLGKVLIFLDDVKESILTQPTSNQFASLKTSLLGARGVLWISSQATGSCHNPKAALSTGFLRTLRAENSTKRFITVDIKDGDLWIADAIVAIVKTYTTTFNDSDKAGILDSEFAVTGKTIMVPRLYEVAAEIQSRTVEVSHPGSQLQPFHQRGRELRMDIQIPGMIDSVLWHDDPHADLPIPDGWVEIEPKAFGLNFRDVMVAMAQLESDVMGFECCGIITRIGAGVSGSLFIGARACCIMFGHWGTHVRVPWTSVGLIPDSMTFETGASIPIVFLTAYHSLCDIARLEEGETVLIHSAAGGVGQAAIMIAQSLGAEVFVTVGSKEKREFIHTNYGISYDHIYSSRNTRFAAKLMAMTKNNGIDVILNSLAGALLQVTWSSIARFGRFVEIGKRDLEASSFLEMSPFARSASFFAVDLLQIQQFRGKVISQGLEKVLSMLAEGSIRPVAPITVYPISGLGKALRSMQAGKHLGKIVVTPVEGDLVKMSTDRTARLPADASYLIVGGVGGIGRSIAFRLVERGARNLILASRSAQSSRNFEFIDMLRAKGCNAVAKDCNVCNDSDVARVMRECALMMPPVRGIIQAAMVLQDAIFENMNFDDYNAAVRPKVLGTWNLHQQSLSLDLDFFILLSSLSGIIGSSGQCNYAAGNTFEDAVARHRTSRGLPGLSIDLGVIRSVGYVSENVEVAERLERAGNTMLEEEEVLRLIERGIITTTGAHVDTCQIITGLPQTSSPVWDSANFRENAMFSTLRTTHDSSIEIVKSKASAALNLKAQLQEVSSWDDAVDHIGTAIIKKLADMFGISEHMIEASAPLSRYGVDSLVAVELRNWLVTTVQAEATIFDVTQSSSIAVLATKVAKKSSLLALEIKIGI